MPADVRSVTLALLADRAASATICPSEIARAIATPYGTNSELDWRAQMPIVHNAVDELLAEKLIRLSWKGKGLAERIGPYRVALARP